MRRIVFAVSLFLFASTGFAQKGKVSSANSKLVSGDLEGAKNDIELALGHVKSKDWAKTWLIRGKIAQEAGRKNKSNEEIFNAYEYFQKALELDEKGDAKGKGKGRYQKEIKVALTFFRNDMINAGVEGFKTQDYKAALGAFEKVVEMDQLPVFAGEMGVDTAIIYNCALAATNGENHEEAVKYYKESIKYNYGGVNAYILLYKEYQKMEDTENYLATMQEAFEKYPEAEENAGILVEMIQYYLDSDQTEDAMKYLNAAIDKEPSNATYWFAKGTLHERKKEFDPALECYGKAVEFKPDYFRALYNISAVWYNKGVEQNNVANGMKTDKEYKAAMEVANDLFKKSLEPMEKALEITPDDKDALETLKSLYYRFKMMDKYEAVKTKLDELNK